MKKKTLNILTIFSATAAVTSSFFAVSSRMGMFTLALEPEYEILLNSSTTVNAEDSGYLHEAVIRDNVAIDMIGYETSASKFGVIKQKTYGTGGNAVTYKGVLYNRDILTGFKSINVTYSGDDLYYTFSEYLMEDMSFTQGVDNLVSSGTTINVNNADYGYFAIYTSGTSTIESMSIKYTCDSALDASMVFNKNSTLAYARSTPSATHIDESYLVQTNNPNNGYTNYSTGDYKDHAKTWYRWNGRRFDNSANLGQTFELHTTIMGNISQVINPDSHFNYSVWPEFKINGTKGYWEMIYIGNDNYEPLGKDNPDRIHKDTDGDYSYAGRFFTNYKYYGPTDNDWYFANPDVDTVINDSTKTLRDAYEEYTLPFWHVKFSVYQQMEQREVAGVMKDYAIIYCDVYVNGFEIIHDELSWEDAITSDISINTYHMHCVNYANPDGTPQAAYKGLFTYPRIA